MFIFSEKISVFSITLFVLDDKFTSAKTLTSYNPLDFVGIFRSYLDFLSSFSEYTNSPPL